MKSGRISLRSVAFTFVLAVLFYAAAYSWLSRRQTAKGPWEVTFTNDVAGAPEIIVAQPRLGISNVRVRFAGEKLSGNVTELVRFSRPRTPVPFGEVIYDDLMFLPGTVTLDVLGHEVELLPRVLVLNGQPVTWRSDTTHTLWPTNKLPAAVRAQRKGGYRKTR